MPDSDFRLRLSTESQSPPRGEMNRGRDIRTQFRSGGSRSSRLRDAGVTAAGLPLVASPGAGRAWRGDIASSQQGAGARGINKPPRSTADGGASPVAACRARRPWCPPPGPWGPGPGPWGRGRGRQDSMATPGNFGGRGRKECRPQARTRVFWA
jgi:hypothetical protein